MSFTPSGWVNPSTTQVISDINQIFINVFGADVNLNASSPNGQFINQLANVAVNNNNFMTLLTASLYNPQVATTVWLDAICAFNGIVRLPATYSVATCTCSGSSGVVIPANTQIANTSGDVFANASPGTIGAGGTVDIVFTAVESGLIPVDANTLTNIINKVYGWDSVNNASDGTLGSSIQSDNELRAQRSALLATYGSSSVGSIYSAIYDVDGVTDVFVAENNNGYSITTQGVTLVANSIYVAAIGGAASDIAKAIYTKKCPGVAMNGNTTTTYTDPEWNYAFTATYERPVATPLQVNLSLRNSTSLPADIVSQCQHAIVNNFYGQDTNVPTMLPVTIGQIINVSRFVPSLIAIGAWDILVLTIQLYSGGSPAVEIQLDADLIASLIINNVIVTLV